MATKKTGKDRGRPKVALRDHPDRSILALYLSLVGRGVSRRKAAWLCALSEFPEVEADEDFRAKHPGDGRCVGFDLSKIARGDPKKKALKRLDGRADWLRATRDFTDDDRHWLMCASAAILLNGGTLSARQKAAATAFLRDMAGERDHLKR